MQSSTYVLICVHTSVPNEMLQIRIYRKQVGGIRIMNFLRRPFFFLKKGVARFYFAFNMTAVTLLLFLDKCMEGQMWAGLIAEKLLKCDLFLFSSKNSSSHFRLV